ncbi:pyridoxal phosphate-dependent aminotransferase [Methanobrevibacter sp. OttesenSCG-928-K11]|nr:pyridoxal phosphate-dependent aminotransferase [Methanobrevibacter sp. OttesenSCG-928-K11]MDL2270558.1 pyridoxal phosphate-dependent aminotransferase [Methanobrevibacter sp. OttesenSCG-928-I08]
MGSTNEKNNNSLIPDKKYKKTEKKAPKGFDSPNDFFEHVFNDKEMIWMGQNTNHLHGDEINSSMIKCVKSKEYCKYPPPEGFSKLKKLVLKDLALENLDIILTAGGTESLYLCMQDLLTKEDNVITCDPGYLIIGSFASRFAKEVKYVPIYNEECNYKLTPELVKENMDENTKMIILIDPLNPLGTSYTEEEIKEFAKIAIENDIYLLHDITYRDFAKEHSLVAKYAPENTVTVYSFSKIYGMAGLRIGGVISTKPMIDSIKNVVVNDLGVNVIAQIAAISALESKDSWISRIKNTTFNNQKLIKETIDEIDDVFLPVYPSEANMIVIDLSKVGINPKDMAEYLLDKKVFTREGNYTSKLFGDKYLRVSFSIPTEEVKVFCDEFKKAVDVLKP